MKKLTLLILVFSSVIFLFHEPAQSAFWWRSYRLPKELKGNTQYQNISLSKLNDTTCLVFLFDYGYDKKNKTYLLNTSTFNYKLVFTDSCPPVTYKNNLVSLAKNKVMWYGVQEGAKPQTWVYDYNSLNWHRVYPKNPPDFTDSFKLAQVFNNKVFLLGTRVLRDNNGNPVSSEYETWLFDYPLNTWFKLEFKNKPVPGATEDYISYIDDAKIFFFESRLPDAGHVSKSYIIDFAKQEWINQNPPVTPAGRPMAGMDFIDKGIIAFYGGFETTNPSNLDTTYIYDYKQNNWFGNYLILQPKPGCNKLNNIGGGRAAMFTDSLLWVLYYSPEIVSVDTLGPQIIETTPKNGGKDVPVDTRIIFKFDKPIDKVYQGYQNILFDTYPDYNDSVYFIDDYTVQYVPKLKLVYNKKYEFTVLTSIMDIFGFRMKQEYKFSFTTGSNTDVFDGNAPANPEFVITENNIDILRISLINTNPTGRLSNIRLINILGFDVTSMLVEYSDNSFAINKSKLSPGLYLIIAEINGTIQAKSIVI